MCENYLQMFHYEEQSDLFAYEIEDTFAIFNVRFENRIQQPQTFLIVYLLVSPSLNIAIPGFSVPGWKYDRMSEMTQRMYVRSFIYQLS